MKSHPVTSFLIHAISALLFISCNPKPDNFKLIPEDAGIVLTADLRSLAVKASLSDVMKMSLFKTLEQEIKAENRNFALQMDDIKNNPTASGITFDDGLAYWLLHTNENESYQCMSMSLSSRRKFEKTVRTLFSDLTPENKVFFMEKFYFMKSGWNSMIAWDKEKALYISSVTPYSEVKMKKALAVMFNAEKNILNNADFNQFLKKNEDLNLWINLDYIVEIAKLTEVYNQANSINFDYFDDSYMHSFLSFEKDKIEIDFEVSPGEIMKKIYESDFYLDKFNQDLLKKIPATHYLLMGFAVNLPVYYELMMKTNLQMKSIDSLFSAETGWELKPLLESLKGSVVMSLYNFDPKPRFAVVFDLNNNELIKKLMLEFPDYMNNGEIQIVKAGEMAIYIYCGKDFLIAANDETLIQSAALGKNISPSLYDKTTGKNMTKSPVYCYLDLNFNQYPGFVSEILKQSGLIPITLDIIDSYASNLELLSTDRYHNKMIINTENKNKNSLFALISLINEYYSKFTTLE